MKVLAIAGANVKRMFRERSNIFFVFIFPLALILLIGAQFGGGFTPLVGVYSPDGDRVASAVMEGLAASDAIDVAVYEDRAGLLRAVERGQVNAGLFLPPETDQVVASGSQVPFEFVARPDGFGSELQSVVGSVIAEVMKPVGAARFVNAETGVGFELALPLAQRLAASDPGFEITVRSVGDAVFPASMGRFDLGAPQQLVLFTFLTGLTGSAALILTRQLGLSRRMLSTPTSVSTILLGESLGRFGVAIVQGVYIVAVTLIAFGVNWGDPIGVAAILIVLSAVGAGGAMLLGSVFKNVQQAGGVSVILSLGLAALGGGMMAIEFFPPTMQRVALITPHAWAIDGFSELIRHDGTILDILPQLGVLAAMAVALLALATWRLRVAITRA